MSSVPHPERNLASGPALDVVVGLGSNLGERAAHLGAALVGLRGLGRVTAISSLYDTEPLGPPQPHFLNAAVRFDTTLTPGAVLAGLLEIERREGRMRRERWGPRTLDLDLLWIAGTVLAEPQLTVPHARLSERAFALLPLLEVAPDAVDPRTGLRYHDVLTALPGGAAGVRRLSEATWPPSLL